MADDPSKRGAQDRSRIAMHEEHEVRYWTQALGVTKEQLAEAVQRVGNSAERVRATRFRGPCVDHSGPNSGPAEAIRTDSLEGCAQSRFYSLGTCTPSRC